MIFSLLLAPLFVASYPAMPIPPPTGKDKVGTRVLCVKDGGRKDPVERSHPRTFMVQLWYPTNSKQTAEAPFLVDRGLYDFLLKSEFASADVLKTWSEMKIKAVPDAEPAGGRRPLLLLSHGLGNPRALYTGYATEMASHGYIVAAIDHPYGGMSVLPDGRQLMARETPSLDDEVAEWAADASLVLDTLLLGEWKSRIDVKRIGMFGHSMGGMAALVATQKDKRLRAVANLDGGSFPLIEEKGTHAPTLILRSQPVYSDEENAKRGRTPEWYARMEEEGRKKWQMVADASTAPILQARVRGMTHMSYSDSIFLQPNIITHFGGTPIDPKRGHEITVKFLLRFFGSHLGGKKAELPTGKDYPEITSIVLRS